MILRSRSCKIIKIFSFDWSWNIYTVAYNFREKLPRTIFLLSIRPAQQLGLDTLKRSFYKAQPYALSETPVTRCAYRG